MSATWWVVGLLAATLVLGACPSAAPPTPRSPEEVDDRALRIRIAQAEARRGAGLPDLLELATRGRTADRVLALRGLGRVGGGPALVALRAALREDEPSIVAAAARGVGVAALLDELAPSPELTRELVAALARVAPDDAPGVIEAIGRAGDATAQPTLRAHLATRASPAPGSLAEAAALALARFGRRKLELTSEVRHALVEQAALGGVGGEAALAALARAHPAGGARPATTAATPASRRMAEVLIARLSDDAPAARAHAIAALARHDLVGRAHPGIVQALRDRDWRVALEAVRALTGDHGDEAGRDAVAGVLARRHDELARGARAEAHVVIEALRALGPHARRPLVRAAVGMLATRAPASTGDAGLADAWIECLARALLVRGAELPELTPLESCGLPDHLRLPILAGLITAKVGSLAQRRAALARLLAHDDARVRAAGIGALASLWAEGAAADHRAAVTTLVGALAAAEPILAGAAVEAAPAIYTAIGTGDRSALDAAVLARAAIETDPELSAAVLALIGSQTIAAGAGACRAGLDRASGAHPRRPRVPARSSGRPPPRPSSRPRRHRPRTSRR